MGTPKALLRAPDGTAYVSNAVRELSAGGCPTVLVVVGAARAEVVAAMRRDGLELRGGGPRRVQVVVAPQWRDGMGASLRAGLSVLLEGPESCALVGLVDTPDVGAPVVRRLLEELGTGADVLGRAAYDGLPGHPVVMGRDHWAAVIGTATGDRGARGYLAQNPPALVECADLASGRDVDTPDQLL